MTGVTNGKRNLLRLGAAALLAMGMLSACTSSKPAAETAAAADGSCPAHQPVKGVALYEVRNWSSGEPGALIPVTVTADKISVEQATPHYGQVSATTCFASTDAAQTAGYIADSGVLTSGGTGADSPQQRRCFIETQALLTAYANETTTVGARAGEGVTALLTQYPFLPATAQVYRSYLSPFLMTPTAAIPYASTAQNASALATGQGGHPDPNVQAAMTSINGSCATALAGGQLQGPGSAGSDNSVQGPASPTPTTTAGGSGQSPSYQDGYAYGLKAGQKPVPDTETRCTQGYATQTNDDRADWMRGCQDGILSSAGA